eukprot:g12543.t1
MDHCFGKFDPIPRSVKRRDRSWNTSIHTKKGKTCACSTFMAKRAARKRHPTILCATEIGFVDTYKGRGGAKLVDVVFTLPGEGSVTFPFKFISRKRLSNTTNADGYKLVERAWSQTMGLRLWVETPETTGPFLRVNVEQISERRPHFIICDQKYKLVLTTAVEREDYEGPSVFPEVPAKSNSDWQVALTMNLQGSRLENRADVPSHMRYFKGKVYTPHTNPRQKFSKAGRQKWYSAPPPTPETSSASTPSSISNSRSSQPTWSSSPSTASPATSSTSSTTPSARPRLTASLETRTPPQLRSPPEIPRVKRARTASSSASWSRLTTVTAIASDGAMQTASNPVASPGNRFVSSRAHFDRCIMKLAEADKEWDESASIDRDFRQASESSYPGPPLMEDEELDDLSDSVTSFETPPRASHAARALPIPLDDGLLSISSAVDLAAPFTGSNSEGADPMMQMANLCCNIQGERLVEMAMAQAKQEMESPKATGDTLSSKAGSEEKPTRSLDVEKSNTSA